MKVKCVNLLATGLLMICCCSCLREVLNEPDRGRVEMTIQATRESGHMTKTQIGGDDATDILWSVGDAISVYHGLSSSKNEGSIFTSTATEPSLSTEFTGTLETLTGVQEGNLETTQFIGVYPSGISYTDKSELILNASSLASQTAQANNFPKGSFVSIGRSSGLTMAFYNVFGGIRFTLDQEGVSEVILKGNNDEVLLGDFSVAFDEKGHPGVGRLDTIVREIHITAPNGQYFTVGTPYYMVFLPTIFEKGFTVTFKKDDLAVGTRIIESKVNIERSMFGLLSVADNGVEYILVDDIVGVLSSKKDWIVKTLRSISAGGNYNWNDPCSDAEYYPEYNSGNGRIGYMRPQEVLINQRSDLFRKLYSIIQECQSMHAVLRQQDGLKEDLEYPRITPETTLYAECETIIAYCYYELIRHFGDVPSELYELGPWADKGDLSVKKNLSLSSRYELIDNAIALLENAEKILSDLGTGGIDAEHISGTFACQLMADLYLMSGGYQTLRTDVEGLYGDIQFETLAESDEAIYARRGDCSYYYMKALRWYEEVLGNRAGSARLLTVDDRGYNNPFQRGFQYIMDMEISPESIFEVQNQAPWQSERPYSQGRPSNGATKNAACCKVFGGIRINPVAYYQLWEEDDLRWDASAVVTGSDGKGSEAMVTLGSGSRLKGGIAINKWDINKMRDPYVTACRQSGMNYQIVRIPQTMLRLAEVKVVLGDLAGATDLLNRLRSRAGATLIVGGATIEDVILETKRECMGEGDIRFVEIRTGKIVEMGRSMREELRSVIRNLEQQGYHTFANGRTISNYVWTKQVDLSGNGKARITFNRDNGNPALTPGWRGSYDYTTTTSAGVVEGTLHNLAIEGLFEYIEPNGAKAASLEADGYKKTEWGIAMVREKDSLWDMNMLSGVELSDVPGYLSPIPDIALDAPGSQVTNGYGFH